MDMVRFISLLLRASDFLSNRLSSAEMLSATRITSMPFNNSTIAPSMEAFLSSNSTRMPRWVLICRITMATPMGITNSMGNARMGGSVIKITTIAAMLLKIAGAKSMKTSLTSRIVPSKHLFSLPWIFPVIFSL